MVTKQQHPEGSAAKRLGLLSVAVLISAAVAFGAVQLARPSVHPVQLTRPSVHTTTKTRGQGAMGLPGPTVARPLGPSATQVSMSQAASTFGSPLALPSTSAVQPSDAGPVWAQTNAGATTVAITFPSKSIILEYTRPAPPDPESHLEGLATSFPGSDLVQLNGTTPALYLVGNDPPGVNSIDFEANGADINVLANSDEATLEGIAQSILARLTASSAGSSSSPRD